MEKPLLHEDALDLLAALEDARVSYLVVGAHALAAHGIPRATADFDILLEPTAENAARAVRALAAFGAPLAQHGITADDLATPGTVYQLGLPPRRIDLLTRLSGVSFSEAVQDRVLAEHGGQRIPVIGREALIRNKLSTGRAKDVLDVELLRAQEEPEAG
ncbi:MAG: hypothetical protein EA398_01685 [Deltaproteobacteria bacterium]|nr:MAG: hypothetical protein EA398_01685 [Deltaproteobacteria bacterium]